MKVGYARAAIDEPMGVQLQALRQAGCEELYTDGTRQWKRRPHINPASENEWMGLKKALATLRRGDALVVSHLNRLAESKEALRQRRKRLGEKGAVLLSLAEGIDTSTPHGRKALSIWSITINSSWGHDWARPRFLSRRDIDRIRSIAMDENSSLAEACNRHSISSPTLYEHIRAN